MYVPHQDYEQLTMLRDKQDFKPENERREKDFQCNIILVTAKEVVRLIKSKL